MLLTLYFFVCFFVIEINADCVYPEKPELIEDLWSLDFNKICPQLGTNNIKGTMRKVENLIPNVVKLRVDKVADTVYSVVNELMNLSKKPVSCVSKILKDMCATDQFKRLRAALSTISVGASFGISVGVKAAVSVGFHPVGIFDMVCLQKGNTEAIYKKIDQFNETMLCAFDKQTRMLTDVAYKNVEKTLKGQTEMKKQLIRIRDLLNTTIDTGFGNAEALAITFHEEAKKNLLAFASFMKNNLGAIEGLLKKYKETQSAGVFSEYVSAKLHNLKWSLTDLHSGNNLTLQQDCKENNPLIILQAMDSLVAYHLLDGIVESNHFSQSGLSNLAMWYQNSMEQSRFYVKLCHSYDMTDEEEETAITDRENEIVAKFQMLHKMWEENFFKKRNIQSFVTDIIIKTEGTNKELARTLYLSLLQNYGSSKYFFYAGVINTNSTTVTEILDGVSDNECYVFKHLGKTVYIMRNVKAEKYVDCSYFDQYSADYPNVFSQEAVAIQYHKNLCPGKQLIVHGGLDYAGEHDYGFNTFAIPYYDDQKQINYVNVIQHLSICDKYCVL